MRGYSDWQIRWNHASKADTEGLKKAPVAAEGVTWKEAIADWLGIDSRFAGYETLSTRKLPNGGRLHLKGRATNHPSTELIIQATTT